MIPRKAGEQINPDKIQIVWTTEDVLQVRPDLNKRQAREVLEPNEAEGEEIHPKEACKV